MTRTKKNPLRYADRLVLVKSPEGYRWEHQASNGRIKNGDVSKWYARKATAAANMRKVHPKWWRWTVVDRTGTWEKPKGGADQSRAATDTPPAGYRAARPKAAQRL